VAIAPLLEKLQFAFKNFQKVAFIFRHLAPPTQFKIWAEPKGNAVMPVTGRRAIHHNSEIACLSSAGLFLRKLYALLQGHRLHREGNPRGMQQGIVDEAVAYGLLDSCVVLVAQDCGNFYFNAKIVHTRRILGFLGGDQNLGAVGSQLVFLQVLRRVKTHAGTQRRQQKFGRSHALVESTVLWRLIARYPVLSRRDLELHTT
jgi:hypothetical protein